LVRPEVAPVRVLEKIRESRSQIESGFSLCLSIAKLFLSCSSLV
jgi:hypothetical protein